MIWQLVAKKWQLLSKHDPYFSSNPDFFDKALRFQAQDESKKSRPLIEAYRRMRYLRKIQRYNLPETSTVERAVTTGTWQEN